MFFFSLVPNVVASEELLPTLLDAPLDAEDVFKGQMDSHMRMASTMATMYKRFSARASENMTMERVHKLAKRYAAQRRNTRSYEISSIEDVTAQQFHDRQDDYLATYVLVGAAEAKGTLKNALVQMYPSEPHPLVARVFCSTYGQITRDDVVFFLADGVRHCGQVKLHLKLPAYNGANVSFIEAWERTPTPEFEPSAHRYRAMPNAKPYDSSAILGALTYSVSSDIATVLVPPLYR